MGQVIVGIADCAVSADPEAVLVAYAAGSCIAATAHDPAVRVAGGACMGQVIVGIADCGVSVDPVETLLTGAVGASITATAQDPAVRVAGEWAWAR